MAFPSVLSRSTRQAGCGADSAARVPLLPSLVLVLASTWSSDKGCEFLARDRASGQWMFLPPVLTYQKQPLSTARPAWEGSSAHRTQRARHGGEAAQGRLSGHEGGSRRAGVPGWWTQLDACCSDGGGNAECCGPSDALHQLSASPVGFDSCQVLAPKYGEIACLI